MRPFKALINGHKVNFNDNRHFARYLIDLLVSPYSPFKIRKTTLCDILRMAGFVVRAKFMENIKTEEAFEKAYWEALLSLEWMGTLPGFAVTVPIGKGNTGYNPEKKRIS